MYVIRGHRRCLTNTVFVKRNTCPNIHLCKTDIHVQGSMYVISYIGTLQRWTYVKCRYHVTSWLKIYGPLYYFTSSTWNLNITHPWYTVLMLPWLQLLIPIDASLHAAALLHHTPSSSSNTSVHSFHKRVILNALMMVWPLVFVNPLMEG